MTPVGTLGAGKEAGFVAEQNQTQPHTDVQSISLGADGLGDADLGSTALRQFAQYVMEHLPDPAYWIREDGTFIYVNAAAARMLGYSRSELMRLKMFDINPSTDEDRWKTVWRALLEQGHRTFRSQHRTKTGELIDVEISADAYTFEGETFSCAFSKDDRARRAIDDARSREHSFVESLIVTAPVIVLVLDAKGCIERINRCAEVTTGYTLEEVRGKHWVHTFVPETERSRVMELFNLSYAGASHRGLVYPILNKQNEERQILWHDQLVPNPETGDMALLAVGQDITEQRKLEHRLVQAERLEAIGRLAGGVAHDFNNQLAGIMGWTEILRHDPGDPSVVTECAEHIMTAIQRSSDLTMQLLAYARKGKYTAKLVNMHDVVHEVVAILNNRADKKITITTELKAHPCTTMGDPSQLSNAVLNIALNAWDALADNGSLAFTSRVVSLGAADVAGAPHEIPPGDFVELSVTDNGAGMDEHTQRHMFEPFFTTKPEGRGTGMGLAAVYGTTKAHRGMILVKSAVGKGTVVQLRLPLSYDAIDYANAEPHAFDTSSAPLRVLLVDDEEVVRDVTVRLLQRIGCQVAAFDNGFDAINYYASQWQQVDVVILDMVMPLLDGKSTFRELRKISPNVKVLLASGYTVEGDAQVLLSEGAVEFIQKPFRLATLRQAIDKVRTLTPIGVAL